MRKRPGHGTRLSYYDFGKTVFYACQADRRFAYCAYIPESYDEEGTTRYPLTVVVHGSARTPETYREHWLDFAEREQSVVLLPLFPVGAGDPQDESGYKFLAMYGVGYDQILLAMLDEAAARWRVEAGQVLLHGFSGGGHFAHRFFYLHPERLRAVSIGAPGMVTLLDSGLPWWRGVADLEARFGRRLDLDALRRVPVQMVVGANDTETWEITLDESSPFWMPGANDAGCTRIDRLRALQGSFAEHGIPVRFDLVPAVAHNGYAVLGPVKDFFAAVLRGRAGAEGSD